MTLPASGQKWLDTLESMRATIAELAAERDRYRDALVARHGGEPLALLSELDAARAERDAAISQRDYFAGYEADLVCIRKTLDEHDAPHDCEEGTSLEPTRIRLLANQRDAAVAKCAGMEQDRDRWASRFNGAIADLVQQQEKCAELERMLGVLRSDLESTNAALAAANGKLGALLAASRDCRDWLKGINVYEGDDQDGANNHDNGIIDGLAQAIAAAEQGGAS